MKGNDRPLRAVLLENIVVDGTWYHKGEVYDISAIEATGWGPMVGLWVGSGVGPRLLEVPPSKILVLAPGRENKARQRRHNYKKHYKPKSKKMKLWP